MSNFRGDDWTRIKPYAERLANFMNKVSYTFLMKEKKEEVDRMDLETFCYFLKKNGKDAKWFEYTINILGIIGEMKFKGIWQQEQHNKLMIEKGNTVFAVRTPLSQDHEKLLKVIHGILYDHLIESGFADDRFPSVKSLTPNLEKSIG